MLTVGAMRAPRFHEQVKDIVRTWGAVVNFRLCADAAFVGVDEAGAIRAFPGLKDKVQGVVQEFLRSWEND